MTEADQFLSTTGFHIHGDILYVAARLSDTETWRRYDSGPAGLTWHFWDGSSIQIRVNSLTVSDGDSE